MSNKHDTIADPNVAAAIKGIVEILEEMMRLDKFPSRKFILDKLRTVRAQLRGGETSVGSA